MPSISLLFRRALLLAALATSSTALAHPRLESTVPADRSTGPATHAITLQFSEALVGDFSRANVVMTTMPGMTMNRPMAVPTTSTVTDDGKTLVITPKRTLPTGSYRVDWHVVSTDTHAVSGTLSFEVKSSL